MTGGDGVVRPIPHNRYFVGQYMQMRKTADGRAKLFDLVEKNDGARRAILNAPTSPKNVRRMLLSTTMSTKGSRHHGKCIAEVLAENSTVDEALVLSGIPTLPNATLINHILYDRHGAPDTEPLVLEQRSESGSKKFISTESAAIDAFRDEHLQDHE